MKSLMTKKLNRVLTLVLTFMALMAGQTAWAADDWTVTNPTGSKFRITRPTSHVGTTETVKYRTVSLSAYAGQHYTAVSGDVAFGVNDTYKEVTVTERTPDNDAYAYKYQTGTKRKYRFEVTDLGGFHLAKCDREITTGTQFSADKVSKSITNLVYFNSSGNYTSGVSSSKYLDVSYTPPSSQVETSGTLSGYVLIDDSYDYANKAATVSTSDLINTTGATAAYLNQLNYKIVATVCFTEKERDDGYQYIQIIAGNGSAAYDTGYDPNGSVNDPVNSVYKACFELSDGSNAEGKQFFPHGYDYANKTAETNAKIGITEFSQTNGHLWQQKYQSGYSYNGSGSLMLPANTSYITTRFDAGGDNDDTWGYKDLFVRMALVDKTAPSALAYSVAPGRHSKGNTVYVTVAFNEIITSSSAKLTSNWGDLSYVDGSGSNVLTFSRTIPENASSSLNITGCSGITDLAGNAPSSVSSSDLCSVDASFAYTITYNLGEGVLPDGYPTTYTYDAAVTLTNPTKTGYWFNGWTGSNGNTPNTTVTIVKNSHGNKSYTANWTNVWGVSEDVDGSTADKAYTITTTQGLDLLAQYVNSGNETSGKFFQLGGPIEYTHTTNWDNSSSEENNYTAIGTYSTPFKGTFDGNNNTISGIRIYSDNNEKGLFGMVSGGTVKRVNLANARITAEHRVGGIAGNTFEATIEDCIVGDDVCIHTVANDASNHGGIVGNNQAGPVRRCISRARLTVADGVTNSKRYGGIVGYNNGGTITDCIADGVVIPDVKGRGAITGYQNNGGTITRNYYRDCKVASESVTPSGVGKGNSEETTETSDVTTNQGALPLYAVTLPANTSLVRTPATDPTLPGSGNKTYTTGADIDGVPYAIAGATLNLSYRIAALTGYTVAISAAQTTGGASVAVTDNGDYTYIISSMPAADVTVAVTPTNVWGVSADIDGSTAEKAYTITTTAGLDLLATLVNNGEFRNFEGKFFKLGDDITYTHGNSNTENNYTAIGGYYNGGDKYFCGTFDGQGHTVRGIRIYKAGTTNADDNVGLFGITFGATIKNVILADARITGKQCVGGIAGYISPNNGQGGIVENCRVGSDVTIHAAKNYAFHHGGVVGDCNGGTISGCVSAATLTMANGLTDINTYGGIVGSLNGNMSDCLALNATVPAVLNNGAIAGYVGGTHGTHTNNYHHGCTVGGNAAQSDTYNVSAYTISAGTNVTVAPTGDADATYEYKGIQRYGNALYYGGKFYAPEAANVSFTLDYPVPAGLTLDYTATAGTLNLTPHPSPSGEGSYTLTVPAEDVTINATLSLKYIAANGTEQTCYNPTVIQSKDGNVSLGTSANDEAWYVVLPGAVTINGKLTIRDKAVHLILCDGASLSATSNNIDGIDSEYGLTIYGQSQQSGTLSARSNGSNSGIKINSGDFTVNGGNITATSKNQIGIFVRSGSVTINRGSVTATSEGTGSFADAINAYNVTINGGTVSATGGEYGIRASTITLGYTNPTDHIYASKYSTFPTVKSGQALTDGSAAYSSTVSTSDINGKTLWPDLWNVAGGNDGSSAAKAYTITTTGGLDQLAAQVNCSNDYLNFKDKFFRLGDDITYSHATDWNDATSEENNFTAIGTYNKTFCGTFDGQGHTVRGIRIYKNGTTNADSFQGLFGETSDATIKNVILTDARITGKQYVGGIAGYIANNNDQGGIVENCRVGSDVTIHAVADYAFYHGGVVGYDNGGTIRGCVSAATLTVANGLTGIDTYGGIVGFLNGNMSDCLALGASVPAVDDRGAIVGYVNLGTQTNNYYHDCTVGNATHQSDAYTISAGTNVTVAPAGDADATYLHNGIQRYGDALYYNGVIYVPTTAAGNDFSLTLGNTGTPATGFVFNGYTATAGTLNLTPNPSPSGEGSYTLTIPAEDVTINAALAVPYIDEKGEEQICRDYTLITSSDEEFNHYGTDGQTNWYVVSGNVTINGLLCFRDSYSHLIVCDGASLSVSSSYDAIYGQSSSLTIYGQAQGGGTITANGHSNGIIVYGTITINGCTVSATGIHGINANRGITINRGTVTATCDGGCGIFGYNVTINGGIVNATSGDKGIYAEETITLGWTDPTDRIYASSYAINYEHGVAIQVKSGQTMTDGSAAYSETLNSDQIAALAGKTLWSDLWGVASGNDGSTAEKAYTISDSWGLDQLAAQVNEGNNFNGKYFRLGDDITYNHTTEWDDATSKENNFTAIGGRINDSNKYFSGTFDGQGKTVRGIRIYKAGTTNADDYQGLFGRILGATIKNVILADARITGKQYVGGIAGYIVKNNNQGGIVENCRVGSDVTIHAVADYAKYHGGVVGRCNGGTIFGCVSAATLTAASSLTGIVLFGGIVGFLNGNMSDCLALGASVPVIEYNGAIAGYVDTSLGTHTNNYYHDCTIGANTHQSDAYTVSAGTYVTVAPAGDAAQTYKYDGIKRYGTAYDGNALYYDGVIYVPIAVAGNDITLSVLGAEYVSGGITYSPTAYNVEYNDGTAQSFSINPDANGQATFQMPAFDAEVVASATGPVAVTYIDENGTEQRKAYAEVTFLESSTGSTVSLGKMDEEHWFAVSGNVSITYTANWPLFFKGASRLILCDDAKLTVSGKNPVNVSGNLVIYGQSEGTGSLVAEGSSTAIDVDSYGTIDDNGTLTINGGNVTAHSTGSNGITSNNSFTINGGTVRATGDYQYSNGISSVHGDVTINGGNVTATGGDRNPGIQANGTITLGWTSATDRIKASSYSASTISVKTGQTLYNDFTALKGNITANKGDLAGKTLEPGIPFIVDYYILLDDDSQQPTGYKNADRLAALNFGSACDIMLYGRTLYRDGDWNTLCLPFNISGEEIEYEYYNNPLHGATIMYFDDRYWHDTGSEVSYSYIDGYHRSGEVEDGSLHLYFNSENKIDAGYPYIVKWETTGDPIVNPVFKDVVVTKTTPYEYTTEEGKNPQTGPGNVTFRGTYSPIKYESDNHSILFLGMNNTLYWPKEGAHIGAFRAYFELGNGITVGEEASQVRSFNLGFGEGSDETGIDSMHNSECLMLNEADAWYSLDGRKLDGKPNAKGMYIRNGKKVVIK